MADNLSTDDFNEFILEKEEEMKSYTEGDLTNNLKNELRLIFLISRIMAKILERKYNPIRKKRHRNKNELRREHFPKNF